MPCKNIFLRIFSEIPKIITLIPTFFIYIIPQMGKNTVAFATFFNFSCPKYNL